MELNNEEATAIVKKVLRSGCASYSSDEGYQITGYWRHGPKKGWLTEGAGKSYEEAFRYIGVEICIHCKGSGKKYRLAKEPGWIDPPPEKCRFCKGRGYHLGQKLRISGDQND